MGTIEVETSVGKFVLKTPTAGARNNAAIKAEGSDGKIKHFLFLTEMLPACIASNPFDARLPLRTNLDNLPIEDYDKLTVELSKLLKDKIEETEKEIKK